MPGRRLGCHPGTSSNTHISWEPFRTLGPRPRESVPVFHQGSLQVIHVHGQVWDAPEEGAGSPPRLCHLWVSPSTSAAQAGEPRRNSHTGSPPLRFCLREETKTAPHGLLTCSRFQSRWNRLSLRFLPAFCESESLVRKEWAPPPSIYMSPLMEFYVSGFIQDSMWNSTFSFCSEALRS